MTIATTVRKNTRRARQIGSFTGKAWQRLANAETSISRLLYQDKQWIAPGCNVSGYIVDVELAAEDVALISAVTGLITGAYAVQWDSPIHIRTNSANMQAKRLVGIQAVSLDSEHWYTLANTQQPGWQAVTHNIERVPNDHFTHVPGLEWLPELPQPRRLGRVNPFTREVF